MKELFLYILYYDFCYYFLHRLLHTKLFYPIHKIHHKKYKPDFYDFYTIHIVEIPLTSMGIIFAIYLHQLYIYQLLYAIMFINIRGVMSHDYRCIFFIGNHHLLHHKFIKCNYGEYWLDYIFGTLNDNSLIT
jgi:sterol desaturase/sphingolipid hydroxylase (fatty acid hydroxylase superfamily)